jgi:hypothetical protein
MAALFQPLLADPSALASLVAYLPSLLAVTQGLARFPRAGLAPSGQQFRQAIDGARALTPSAQALLKQYVRQAL